MHAHTDSDFNPHPAYMATSTYNNDIYLAGGTTKDQPQNKVYKLTPDFKHHDLPELPVPRVLLGTCIIGSKYYVFGGCKHINQVWTSSNAMFVLDLNNIQQGWQKGTGIPGEGRADFSYTRSGGHIYVFGGMNSDVNGPILNFKDAYKYDPETEKWQRLADLPVAIRSSATCTYDDRYIFKGGIHLTQATPTCSILGHGNLPRVRGRHRLPPESAGV